MFISRAIVVAAAASATWLSGIAPASATGEQPHDYAIPASFTSHFYELGITRVPTPVGAPYVTTVGANTVLSLDWDGEVAESTGSESRSLGILPLPAQSRVLDFQQFTEWPTTATSYPVFLSYAYLDEGTQCRHVVLREATIDPTGAGGNFLGKVWFRSPCFPMVDSEVGSVFLNQSGGRMALVPRSQRRNPKQPEFMLGVGDMKVMVSPIPMSKAAKNILGTIIQITAPGKYEVFARGLRNVQGLVYGTMDGKPAVLATSQGPRGGDEIVHATKGSNFGWPYRNYGTAYRPNDGTSTPGREGSKSWYDRPLFAWLPSIGLSDAIQLKGPAFQPWWVSKEKNATPDLLVSGMGARWLYRVRIDQGAVRYYEGIPILARARSLAQFPDGRVVVGLDAGTEFLVIAPTGEWNSSAGQMTAPR